MPRLDRLWYVIDAETKGFEEGVLKSGQKLRSFTEYANGHPLVVMGALSAAFAVAGFKALRMAEDYEKSMKMVQTVTDTTVVSMEDLSNGVLKTFESLPIGSLDELTKGLYDIISSGVPAGDAIAYLNTAAKAAVGGVTSVATAVDGLTSATNAWAAQGLTAADAADQMFQAVNKGKLTFEQVSTTIGEVAGAAAGLNVSLADVLAVQAQLTLSGYSAAEAMTAVRQMMQEIVHPTGQLQQQFPDLARQFGRAKLEGEGLVGFLLDFEKASKGNGAAMSALFTGVQAQFGAMALLKDQGAGLTKMLNDVKNSEGAAGEAARIMGSSAIDTEQVLKNKLHAELIRGGTSVLPLWMGMLKGANALLREFNDLASGTPQLNIARDVAAHTPEASKGALPVPLDASYRKAVLDTFDAIRDGVIDTSKLTTRELEQLLTAFRQNIKTEGLLVSEETKNTLDALAAEVATRKAAAEAAATTQQSGSDARIRALGQEGAQLAQIVTQAASAAKEYRGMGDEASRAQIARAGALDAIASAEASVADARAKLAAAVDANDERGAKAALAQIRAAQTAINDQHEILTTAGEQLTQAAKRMYNAQVALRNAADEYARQGEASPVEEAENKIRSLVQEAKNAHVELSAIDSAVATIRAGAAVMAQRNARTIMEDIQTQLVAATGDVVQQAQRAAEEQIRTLGERIRLSRTLTSEQKAQADVELEAIQRALQLKITMTSLQQGLDDLNQRDAENQARGIAPGVGDLNMTISLAMRASAVLRDQTASSEDQRKARALLLAIDQKRLELLLRQAGIITSAVGAEAALRRAETARIQDQARGIQQAISLTTELAAAFGLVNDSIASTVNSVGQMITAIGPLTDAIANLDKVDEQGNPLATLSTVLGATAPLVGGLVSLVGSLVGPSKDDQLLAENNRALRDLTKHVGDLAKSTISGQDFSGARAGVDAILKQWEQDRITIFKAGGRLPQDTAKIDLTSKHWTDLLDSLGLSMKQIEDAAKALGITLTTMADVKVLAEAIKKADLAAYTDTFAGAMENLSDTFHAFNITDPTEKIRRTLAVLTNPKTGIPGLASALAGIDLTSADGIQAGIKAAQQFFEDLSSGTITAAQLGGASISDARQAVLDFLDLLRSGGAATPGTGGFNVSQQITEVTGSRIGAILSTSQIFLQQIADNTAIAARMLGGSPSIVTPILPPVLTPPTGAPAASGAGGISVGDIHVHIHTTDLTDPQLTTGTARQVGSAVATEIDRALGTQLLWRARGRGTVTR